MVLGPDGRGRTLRGGRRMPKEKALALVRDAIVRDCPELTTLWVEGDLPAEVPGGTVVLVPDVLAHPDVEEWSKNLPDSVIVICSQEICHQVTVHFRVH